MAPRAPAGAPADERNVDLGALLAAVPDAMIAADRAGRIIGVNARCEQLLGYRGDELVGQPVEVLIPEALRERHEHQRAAYAAHPAVRDMGAGLDLVAICKDGSRLAVDISLAPLDTDSGSLVLAALRDVSRSRHDERLFRRFLEAAPDAVVVVDDAGLIALVNAQVEQMFGYDRAELLGQTVEVLVPERLAGMHEMFRDGYVDNPRVRPIGLTGGLFGRRKDGSEFPVEISLSPVQTEEGLLVLADVRDITERLAVAAAMREAEERQRVQEETNRVKEEFLATVSHELRTPLASVVGYTELISDHEELSSECQHFVSVIMRNARRELRLVDDLLTLVNITRSGLSIRPAAIDLVGVVRDAVDSAQPQADAAGLAVHLELPRSALMVSCDGDRIGQALDSLLSNAVKFTPPGGQVTVCLYATDTMARIEVTDSGTGIGEAEPHRVFERLYRSPSAVAQEVPGAGLGLSIAAAIVEAHHGSIRVLHSDESGSTFGLQIPLAS